ncbi:Na(+)/H(+) antiporter subunit B [Streptomyces sulphureus]|uniref:Na(+)/H(+) antiporter subunit B n=1 Tax=Streptomyces sulphureus TaxID=47758 RepID=UPI0003723B9A|nr:DUF4040 domain-containing protein [Streptomyces sulphureus]
MTELPVLLGLLLATTAGTAAALTRDPVHQALVLSVLGLALALLFTLLQAPDVALSQLAVGTVLTPLMVLLSVRKVRRRPREDSPADGRGGKR